MKKPGDTNTATSAAEQHLLQLRKNIKTQVAELKQMVFNIQQESLKNLQNAVNATFKNLAAENAEQISKQDKEIKDQMEQGIEAINEARLTPGNDPGNENYSENTPTTPYIDGGRKAMKNASHHAFEAMKSAEASVLNTQNMVNKLMKGGVKVETPTTNINSND